MKVFDNYSEYLHEKKYYADWKNAKNDIEAKRLAYISKNNISEAQKKSDIRRAEAVLNSIDIMDEYSQARAEDMEVATEQIKALIIEGGIFGSVGVGSLLLGSKNKKAIIQEIIKNKNYKGASSLVLPAILTTVPFLASLVLGSIWGAGNETKASRLGRAEAINKKLNSPNQFAELTDEQERQIDEIAKEIQLKPKEAKKASATLGFGVLKSFKTMLAPSKSEKQIIDNINKKIEDDKKNFDSEKLTEKEILEAKRDKQLIQNIVEKIDVASQEYAENVELATGIVTTGLFSGGILVGFLTNLVLRKIPSLMKSAKLVSVVIGMLTALVPSIYAAKLQKQASRVGRYIVKRDFMKTPEKLIYADDDAVKNEDVTPYLENKNKKQNLFKFFGSAIKNNKEYKQYIESQYPELKKRSIAREKIELTPEQIQRAKQLQLNTFKVFHKLDEKSQSFSESTEAIWEIISAVAVAGIEYGGIGYATIKALRNNAQKTIGNVPVASVISIAAAFLVASVLQVFVTKEQKQASKVANMLAIKDLDDYRNFVHYDSLKEKDSAKQV